MSNKQGHVCPEAYSLILKARKQAPLLNLPPIKKTQKAVYHVAKKSDIQTISAKAQNVSICKFVVLTDHIFSALEYDMFKFAGFLPSALVQVCPDNDHLKGSFPARGAVFFAHQGCARCTSKEMQEITRSLLRTSGEVQVFLCMQGLKIQILGI